MEKDTAILTEKTRASGEWLTLTFLTPGHGKVKLTARRNRPHRPAPFLDGLQKGELLFRPPDDRRPGRLVSFYPTDIWPAVRSDYDSLVTAIHMAGLAVAMAGECEPAVETFTLLEGMLALLEGGGDAGSLRIVYELRLLAIAGYGSVLDRCCCCGREAGGEPAHISVPDGGLLCPSCRDGRGRSCSPLLPGALSVMRRSLSLPLEKAGRLRVIPPLRAVILPLLDEMVESVIERRLPSSSFLARS